MRVGVLVVSDRASRKKEYEESGKKIINIITKIGKVEEYKIVPDEEEEIVKSLLYMVDTLKLDLILTTGGTGLSPRDITPEATLKVIEKEVPGLNEIIRVKCFSVTPYSILSRGISGVRRSSLIVNLPGSPSSIEESLELLLVPLSHGVEMIKGGGH
jgi:molybdenum cofactor synthesis domain-containing protein